LKFVTNVELVSFSGCETFDKSAMEAVKDIKFQPAIKDGEPVTVFKKIKYSF
jgi:TonB family protein